MAAVDPIPVIVLAVHAHVRDVRFRDAKVIEEPASLCLTRRFHDNVHIKTAVSGDQAWKYEIGVVACNEYIVAAIIHQFHSVARSVYQPYQSAANRETRLRTEDLNCGDVTVGRSGAIRDRAGLPGVGRLRKNRHAVGGAANQRSRESKIDGVGAVATEGEIVAAVVLQYES